MRHSLCATEAGPAAAAPKPAAAKQAAARPTGGASQAKPAKHAHPMQSLGGYQMPTFGRIGGQKGVGAVEAGNQATVKRKREDIGKSHATVSHIKLGTPSLPLKPLRYGDCCTEFSEVMCVPHFTHTMFLCKDT